MSEHKITDPAWREANRARVESNKALPKPVSRLVRSMGWGRKFRLEYWAKMRAQVRKVEREDIREKARRAAANPDDDGLLDGTGPTSDDT